MLLHTANQTQTNMLRYHKPLNKSLVSTLILIVPWFTVEHMNVINIINNAN